MMTKYIVEWASVEDKLNGNSITFTTSSRERAFTKAWSLKNDPTIADVNLKEITNYHFKGDEN